MLQYRNQAGRLWLGGLLLAALLLAALPAAVAAQGATIRIEPLQVQAGSAGDDVQAQVVIEDVENLGFFQFDLTFDPAVVRVKSVALGEFLASTGRTASGVGPVIDNTAGTVTFGAYTVGTQDGPDGAGVLAEVTLTGVADGVSPLRLAKIKVLSAANTVIATFPSDQATVTVGDLATPTPTLTPTIGAGTPVPTLPGSDVSPTPGTVVPSPTATAGTPPAGQDTATAPAATAAPGTPTPEPTPTTSDPGALQPTAAAVATLAAQLARTAEPVKATAATATAVATLPPSQPTAVLTVAAAPSATETPVAEPAQSTATSAATLPADGPSPTPTAAALAEAPSQRPASESGANESEPGNASRWLLGVGIGALGLAGLIILAIIVLVLARRKGS